MKIGKPDNAEYIRDITKDVLLKYDNHEITRNQAIDILSSWEVVVESTTSHWFSIVKEAVSMSETLATRDSVVKLKLHADTYGEYDGNDIVGKWKHISEGIEEKSRNPNEVKNDDDVAVTFYSNILEKVEENSNQAWGSEEAKAHRRQVYSKVEEKAKQDYENAILNNKKAKGEV